MNPQTAGVTHMGLPLGIAFRRLTTLMQSANSFKRSRKHRIVMLIRRAALKKACCKLTRRSPRLILCKPLEKRECHWDNCRLPLNLNCCRIHTFLAVTRASLQAFPIGNSVEQASRKVQTQSMINDSLMAVGENSVDKSFQPRFSLPLTETPLDSWRYRKVKPFLDLFFALVLLAVFAIPGFLIAAAILLTSRGPIFYRERRIGRSGAPFEIWKFRTMHPHPVSAAFVTPVHSAKTSPERRMNKRRNDPRITKIGGVLRRWSLDEVPQLLNVLRGEMSFIGPRPIVESEIPLYENLLSFYLAATPGLSGLWQVSGRSDLDYVKRANLDAFYVATWSLRADLSILLRTIPAVLSRTGAC